MTTDPTTGAPNNEPQLPWADLLGAAPEILDGRTVEEVLGREPTPLCTWPACLTPEQSAELCADIGVELHGGTAPARSDKRVVCGCREEPSAFTWAESVASHGVGPTAVIDIDVHAPGHDEPVPVEIPLDQARVLHDMLGGVLEEHEPTPAGWGRARNGRTVARLRERLERAHTEGFVQSRQIGDLKRELEEAEAALARVRALHHPSSFPNPDAPGMITYCVGCDEGTGSHPCPTITALTGQEPTP